MDWASLVAAVLGSGGAAGVAVAVQNWVGVPRAVHRIRSLVELKKQLTEQEGRGTEALGLAIKVECFRLTARTTARRGVGSAIVLLTLFVVAFLFSPVLTPPARMDPAWLAGIRGTTAGLAALSGGYAALELMIRHEREQLVHRWLHGGEIRPPKKKPVRAVPHKTATSPKDGAAADNHEDRWATP